MTQVGSVSLLGRMLGRRPWYQRYSDGLDVVLQGQEICRRRADLPGRQKSPGTHKLIFLVCLFGQYLLLKRESGMS